ncbi:MAG: nucleotide exchange factor GrpE [Actinomycetota bacterium]
MTSPEESHESRATSHERDSAPVPPTEGRGDAEERSDDAGGAVNQPVTAPNAQPEPHELVSTDLEIEPGPTAHDLGLELPDDPDEAQALLLRELSEARQEAGEHLEMLQRVAADFDNFRRRVERDQAENVERASQRVIENLLPTLDAFDAAAAFEPQSPSEEKIREGMLSTRSQLLETLAREEFEPIPAAGEAFDPKVHEAVSGPSAGDGDLIVAVELRRGYVMRGRVIRPSLVTVEHA